MAQMIEAGSQSNAVKDFYDSFAADYDLMTDFPKRFVRERPFFHMLIDKFHIRSALDAGSGTGFHSLLLAQLGVDVTAVDISPGMISSVRDHVMQRRLDVKALVGGFEEIPEIVGRDFDAVFSLGNSLAHATSKEELLSWLRAFSAVLPPGGVLFLQNLNYDRILSNREKVQSVKEAGRKTFVRYYDYDEEGVIFNILTIEKTRDGILQHHRTIRLLPLLQRDLVAALESAAFTDVQVFGGISMNEFVPGDSKDLVILARRGKGWEKG